ncbi:cadherin-like domain-containing protein [Terasakiella sp.]|uniref:cadherin-like domain-containing protein n=1 Tax=Terasakiella sp. TaxID=2034861 RepID=UPI003AA90C84
MADDDVKKPEDQDGSGNDSGVTTGSQEDATVFDELTSLQDVEDINLGGQMQGKENAESGAVYQEDMGYMASVHQGGFSTEQDVIDGILPDEDDAFKSDEGIYIDDEDSLRDLGDSNGGPRDRRELGQRREEVEDDEQAREPRERAEAPELAPADPNAIDGSVDTLDVFAAPIEDDLIVEEEETAPVEEEDIIQEEPLTLPKDFLDSIIGQDPDDPNGQPGPEKPIIIREEDIIKAIGPFDDIDIDAFYENTSSYLGDGTNGTEDAAQTLAAGIKEGNEEGDGRIVLEYDDNGLRIWKIYTGFEQQDSDIGLNVTITRNGQTATASDTFSWDVDNTLDDDNAALDWNQTVNIDVLSNDTLYDNNIDFANGAKADAGVITKINGQDAEVGKPIDLIVDGTKVATLTLNENGTINYDPEIREEASYSFEYEVTDDNGETKTASVTVDVDGNAAPDVRATHLPGGTEYQEYTLTKEQLLANATDADGDTLSITSVTGRDDVTIVDNGDGTWTITSDEEGLEAITFTVSDGIEETTQTTTINFADVDNTANDDAASVAEDSTKTINVLSNDQIRDGGVLSDVSQPENGEVTFESDGTVTYKPNPDFHGTETFTYTLTDEDGETVTATVTMTVTPENDIPVLNAIHLPDGTEYQEYTVTEEQLLAAASDVDGDALSVTGVSGSSNLVVTDNHDGTWTIISDEEGLEAITFTVSDGTAEVTQTTAIKFADVDNTATDDSATLAEDGSKTINVMSNDDINDGGILSGVTQPENGTVAFSGNGTVTYTPHQDFNGTDTFTYTITDEDGETVTATVTMTVNPENDDPIAVDDITVTEEDQAVTIDLLDNDSDIDGDSLSITQMDGQDIAAGQTITLSDGSGTVTLNADGTVSFDPSDDLNGDVNFSYTISDGQGGTDTATATVTIDAVNDGPVATDDSFSGDEDTTITFSATDLLGNDSDVDSTGLSIAQINGVSLDNFPAEGMDLGNGTLIFNSADNTFSFAPTEDWSGTETLSYTVTDGDGGSAQANIALNVDGVADTPDLAVSLVESGHTGDSVTVTFQDTNAGYHNTYGYYILDENGEPSTGQIIFADLHDQSQGDSFVLDGVDQDRVGFFLLSDGDGENTGLSNGMDVTFQQDAAGNWQVVADGNVLEHDNNGGLYFSDEEFNADDLDHSFDDSDVIGTQNWEDQASQYGGNDFDFNDASFNVDWDTSNSETTYDVNISAAITDDDLSESLTVTIENFPEGATFNMGEIVDGTLVISGDDLNRLEDLTMTVTGDVADFQINVTATATEPNGSTASTSLTVSSSFDPDAIDDTGSVTEGQSITMDVVANDVAGDSESLNIVEINGQSVEAGDSVNVNHGTVTLNEDGSITFAADNGYEGPADFTYTVSDGQGTDTATVNLDITDGNIAPVAGDDTASTNEDTSVVIDLLDNDSDANNDALSITHIDGQDVNVGETITLSDGSGQVTLNNDGTVTFDPSDNLNGDVSFDYTIRDPEGMSDTATVTVDIDAVNDGPVAGADNAQTLEDNAVTFNPLGNDSDVDGDSLSITQINGQNIEAGGSVELDNGTLTLNEDGTVTFNPDQHYAGTQDFTYTVSDGQGGVTTATATVDVEADADAPVISINIGAPEAVSDDGAVAGGSVSGDDVASGSVQGVTISGFDSEGNPAAVEQVTNGHGGGIGVAAHTTGSKDLLGYDSKEGASESLVFEFDEDVNNVSFNVEQFGEGGNGANASFEQGIWEAYDNGELVASGTFDGRGLNNADDTASVSINGVTFDKLVVKADTTINADGSTAAGDSDFAIDNLEFTYADASGEVAYYDYPLDVSAELVDQDGSESLSDVTLSGLPEGAVLTQNGVEITITDGSATVSVDNLDGLSLRVPADAEDFSIDASVTSTDSNGDQATSTASDTAEVPDIDINNGPDAVADSLSGVEDQPITFNTTDLLGNDTDVDGDSLSIVSFDQPEFGTITDDGNGNFTFTPNENWNGQTDFTYTISDGQGGTDTATVSITVDGVNDGPVATHDEADTLEDNAVTFNPLGNDSDVEGDSLSITQINGQDIEVGGSVDVGNGSVTLNADGTVTFNPDGNYAGSQSFEYTVSDGQGGTSTGTANVDVEADADVPDLSVSVGEGVTQTTGGEPVDVMINSENATSTGGGFTVTARTVDENGNLEDTDIAYNNNPVGFGVAGASSGAASEIGYDNTHQASEELVFDFDHDVSSVDVSVSWLHGGEDAIYTMYKDGVEVGRGMIDGGSDRVDPAISLTADGGVDFDQIVFSAEGSGDDYLIHSLEFEVSDGGETTTTYPLNITSGLNDTDGSESLSLSVDGLPDGAVLSAGTQNEDGSWTLSAGDLEGLTVTVPGTGEDFTVEVSATATESSNGDSETVTASANVVANQAPEAGDDTGATTEDHSVVLDLTANDSDANNDDLSVIQINGQDIEVGGSVDVGNGHVTLNEDGTVTFNPDGDFAGTQDFTYTVSDGQGETSTATASVDIEAVADMPELSLEIGEGNKVTLGASEGESSTIFTTTFGQTDGGFYTSPVDGWNTSSDAIEVWDTDGDGSYIELNDDNRDHYADATSINRTVDTVEDATYTVDFDYSGRAGYDETVNAIEVRVNGIVVGEFNHDNANGNDNDWQDGSFTFTGTGEPMTIEFVSVGEAIDYGRGMYLDNIEAVQTLPDNAGEEFVEYPLNLSTNLTDSDGSESLSAVTLSGLPEGAVVLVDGQEVTVSNGTASIASNNLDDVVLRVPADQTDFDLSASVTSTESSNDDSATATVTASVNTNSEPVLSDDSAVTNEDTSVVLDLVANDSDADNDTLTITHINGEEISVGGQVDVGNGTVTLEADGTVTFTPKGDYAGAQSFEYTVSDGEGHSATATADIDVEAVADAPELTVNLGEGQLVGGESSGGAGDSTGGGSASYDNTITGTTDNDYNIVGTNDDDYIDASHGNDRVYAGHGDDYIDGNTGDDVLYADKGDDTVIGGHGNDYLSGDQGDDYLDGGTGHDRIYGGSGDDTIIGDHGNDTLFGGSGDDTISAGTGNDYVSGEDGDDIIDTDSGNDVIYGGSGDDTITAGMGNDYINGQGGNDTLVLSGNSSEYAINAYGGGYLVTHYGSDGTDYIEGVEELQFADGTIDVTDFANGGSVSDSSGGGDSTGGGSSGDAYMEYPLDITVDETDVDGSETLSAVTLSGLPDGAVLLLDGQAVSITNGTATLSSDDLDNLTLRVPSDAGSFELTASVTSTDGDDSATTTVNTAVGNDAPVANNDYATTNEDTAIVLDLVDNDTDTGSDSLSITQIDGVDISIGDTVNVGNGTVTLNADGSINFMPSDDFSGEVNFDYTVSDGQGASDTATASIDVAGVADGAEVSVNIGEGSIQNGAAQSGTISPSNWDDANDGISVTGYTYDSSGGWHSSADHIQETQGGLGVADSSGGKEITDGENITFTFENDLSQATVNLSGLKSQEQADYTLLDDNGHVVGCGTIYGSGDGEISATLTGNSEFSQIVITGEHKTNNYCKTSKFVIDSVDYTPAAAAAVMAYPVTFALSMNDASESLLGDELSVDLSTIPHGSELSIGDATVSIDQNGSISVTGGDDVSVDGSTLKIPSATLGEDLSVSGTVTVPVDENGHHDSFDLTASVQTVDGMDVSIENIDADVAGTYSDEIGTDGNDILYADDNGAQLAGGDGNDILVDGDGDDVMIGGDGDDTFYVSDGEDVMSGGDGNDLFIFSGSADSGTSGQDWVDGGADFDTIHLSGSEGWTLTITNDDGSQDVISSDSATAEQMADYHDVSGLTGQIEFDDGSTVIFEGVEKVEW